MVGEVERARGRAVEVVSLAGWCSNGAGLVSTAGCALDRHRTPARAAAQRAFVVLAILLSACTGHRAGKQAAAVFLGVLGGTAINVAQECATQPWRDCRRTIFVGIGIGGGTGLIVGVHAWGAEDDARERDRYERMPEAPASQPTP